MLVACWCLPFFRSTSISHSKSVGEFRELFDWEFRELFDCPLYFLFLFYVFMVYSLFPSLSMSSSLASSLTHSTILIFPGTIYIRLNLSQPVHQVRRAVPCATDCNASRVKRLLVSCKQSANAGQSARVKILFLQDLKCSGVLLL